MTVGTVAHAQPSIPVCRDATLSRWSPTEDWVWQQLCLNRTADLSGAAAKAAGIADDRVSGRFFADIIDTPDLRRNIGRTGIRVNGADIVGPLDLSNAKLDFVLAFENGTFENAVTLDWVTTSHELIFNGMKFRAPLSVQFVKSTQSLYLGRGGTHDLSTPTQLEGPRASLVSIDLSRSQFDGSVYIRKASVKGDLIGEKVQVGRSFVADHSDAQCLQLDGSSVKGQLDIINSTIRTGCIDHRFKDNPSTNLYDSAFGAVQLNGSTFRGRFYAENIDVKEAFVAWWTHLTFLDLTGSRIGAGLDFGNNTASHLRDRSYTHWLKPSALTLRGARAASILGASDQTLWPRKIKFDGFTYDYIQREPYDSSHPSAMPVAWYIDLMKKQPNYSPQPYEQLAKVLRESGAAAEANELLYAGHNRELKQLKDEGRYFAYAWHFLFLVFIGYGYKIWYTLFWVFGFVVLGACIFRYSPEADEAHMPNGLAFSFDRLLPLVTLRKKKHEDIDFAGWHRYYFYFHQIMGYVLASFLIAGLAGLTK